MIRYCNESRRWIMRRSLLFLFLPVWQTHAWRHVSPEELRQALDDRAKPVLVAFVLPDQTSNQAIENDWTAVERSPRDVNVMSIDCAESPDICIKMDVRTYPAIRLYHPDGRVDRYRGPRKTAPMLSFLRRVSRPVISEVSPESLHGFTSSDDIVFTAEFLASETSLYEEHYRNLAKKYRDRLSFGILPPSKHQSAVRCRNNLENESYTLKELWLVGALDELVAQCTTPLIFEPQGRKDIAAIGKMASQGGKSMVVHYFTVSEKEKNVYRKGMQSLAKKYSEELLFTIIDANEHPMMPNLGGLPDGVVSGVSIEHLRRGEVFPYVWKGKKISATELETFLADVVNGGVTSWDGRHDGKVQVGHDEL